MTGPDNTHSNGLVDGWFKPVAPPTKKYRPSHAAPDDEIAPGTEPEYVPEPVGAPAAGPMMSPLSSPALSPAQSPALSPALSTNAPYAPVPQGAYPVPGPQQWTPPPAYGSPDWVPGYPISGPYFDQPGRVGRRSRKKLVIALIVVAVLLGGSANWYFRLRPHLRGPQRALVVPATFGGYHRLTSAAALQTVDEMRQAVTTEEKSNDWANAYDHALVALYATSHSSSLRLAFIGIRASDNSRARQLFMEAGPSRNARDFMDGGGVVDQTSYDAGVLGGSVRCGHLTYTGVQVTACVWVDYTTLGLVVDYTDGAPDVLASTTLALRAAAEH
jgi:hypothetical protein